MIKNIVVSIGAVLMLVIGGDRATAEAPGYPLTLAAINRQLQLNSPTTIVNDLLADQSAWNIVMLSIDSGAKGWLQLAQTLAIAVKDEQIALEPHPYSMIQMAVGEALLWAPANVLSMQGKVFDIDKVCSLEGLFEWRLLSRSLALTALQRRIDRVKQIQNQRLSQAARQCLDSLSKAKQLAQDTLSDRVDR